MNLSMRPQHKSLTSRFCLAGLGLFLLVVQAPVNAQPNAEAKPEEPAPKFRAAFVDRDITPEIGMEQPGGYGKSFHRTLHDPCKARIGVFHDGREGVEGYAVVVSIDALFVRRPTVLAVRKRVEEETNIPGSQVMIHATHSHSSGPMGMVLPGEYDHADEFVQELAYKKSSMANADYLKHVEDQIVNGVVSAYKKLAPARFGVGRGHESTVAFNRRFVMKNGMEVTHPRAGNPDIVKPAGPVDPEVGVIGVWDDQGKLQGCIVNFVCHATTNPGGISANYIYYVEKVIRGMFGEQAVVVFLAGASGDVTQVDNLSPTVPKAGAAMAALVGGKVGAEAVKVLLTMPADTTCPINSQQEVLQIPRRKPRAGHLEEAYAMSKKTPQEVGATNWTFAKEVVMLDALLKEKPIADVEIQAIQLGPVAIVSVPAEYFCQYGLDIKQGSPFPFTFVASLANGCVGYVPTLYSFGPNGGGYETRLTSYSNLEITAGDLMAETGVKLARKLTPGPVPTALKIPVFRGAGWDYGNLPAQVD